MAASSLANTDNTNWLFPQQNCELTPPAVQDHMLALQNRLNQLQQQLDTLESHLNRISKTSNQPPSSDSSCGKTERWASSGRCGARKGHPGSGPALLPPTEVRHVYPAPCSCGHRDLLASTPYHTHQVMELPPIEMEIAHFVLHQVHCVVCGRLLKVEVPRKHTTGHGPRLTALIGELAGIHDTSNRTERALRFGVLLCKRSQGTANVKGNRWVVRSLTVRQTCRQLGQSTFTVLVDAVPVCSMADNLTAPGSTRIAIRLYPL